MKHLRKKESIGQVIVVLPAILLVVGVLVITKFHTKNRIEFGPGFTEQEMVKIENDLTPQLNGEVSLRVKKSYFSDCKDAPECTQFLVEYVYDQYGDWIPGYLEIEEGRYILHPSI